MAFQHISRALRPSPTVRPVSSAPDEAPCECCHKRKWESILIGEERVFRLCRQCRSLLKSERA